MVSEVAVTSCVGHSEQKKIEIPSLGRGDIPYVHYHAEAGFNRRVDHHARNVMSGVGSALFISPKCEQRSERSANLSHYFPHNFTELQQFSLVGEFSGTLLQGGWRVKMTAYRYI